MPIYTRFAALTLVVSLVALGSATLLWNNSLQTERRQELDQRLLDHARILSSLVPTADNPRLLDKTVRRISKETRSRLTVTAANGRVLAESNLAPEEVLHMEDHSDRPEIQEALSSGIGRAVRRSPTLGIPMAYLAIRWGPASSPHGTVRAALPMTRVIEEQNRGRGRLLLAVVASFLFAGMLGTVLARWISRPLALLSDGARRIAGGDLSSRLELVGGVEARKMAQAVNYLAESVQSEMANLEEERQRLVQLLHGMPDGILALDLNGRIVVVNSAAAGVLGFEGHVLGLTPVEAARSGELQQAVDRVLQSKQAETVEFEIPGPERRTLSVDLVPLATGLVVVLHDVTKLRRLEKARREMVANIRHELRTPLSAILGYLETLEHAEDISDEDRERYLGIISRNSRRLEELVKDLTRLARLETSDIELNLEPLALADVVKGALEALTPRAVGKRVRIIADLDPDLPQVLADRDGLETVILNLLDNAVRVSPQGAEVHVSARAEPGVMRIWVNDQGPGIPRDLRERVFERFFRLDPGRSTDAGGSGLGLAIVKHTVLRLGGQVTVGEAAGGGASFMVTLPQPGHGSTGSS